MRMLLAFVLVGCAQQPPTPEPVDAPPDVAGATCSSANGTANVALQVVGPTKVYERAYGGGILNGVADAPFTLKLVFANQSPVPVCCASAGESCCSDALVAEVLLIPKGGELGSHDANVFDVLGFSSTGTLTITDWSHPFDMLPGHVAGSLTASTGAAAIQGTFDTVFCADMLGAPI